MNKDKVIGRLKKCSNQYGVAFNIVLKQFFFEQFLQLLAKSEYADRFTLKGGMLLTFTLGIENRSTVDIDFLINRCEIKEDSLRSILVDIVNDRKEDDVWFEISEDGQKIREGDAYGGYRFRIIGHLENIREPFAVDIATGDPIYPSPTMETYKTIDGGEFSVKTYPLETVLAEKLHTTLSRGNENTRAKDFYDIYTIMNRKFDKLDKNALKMAVSMTFKYREMNINKQQAHGIVDNLAKNDDIKFSWERYSKRYSYTQGIELSEIIVQIKKLIDLTL